MQTVISVISLVLYTTFLLRAYKAKEEKDVADTAFYIGFAVLLYLTAIK